MSSNACAGVARPVAPELRGCCLHPTEGAHADALALAQGGDMPESGEGAGLEDRPSRDAGRAAVACAGLCKQQPP